AWRKNGKRMNIFYSRVLRQFCRDFGCSYTQPYKDIPKKVKDILMFGTDAKGDNGTGKWFEGVLPNLQRRFDITESDWVQHKLHAYMSEQACPTCNGTRLKPEVLAVRLEENRGGETANGRMGEKDSVADSVRLPGYSIDDVTRMTVERAKEFFETLELSA